MRLFTITSMVALLSLGHFQKSNDYRYAVIGVVATMATALELSKKI